MCYRSAVANRTARRCGGECGVHERHIVREKSIVKNLAIIGGGSWGTALAMVLAPRFERVRLWVYEPDLAERMRATRENDVYLPDFRVPNNVEVHNELAPALHSAGIVLGVMPSHLARGIYQQMAPYL